jgi:hypothetical protein
MRLETRAAMGLLHLSKVKCHTSKRKSREIFGLASSLDSQYGHLPRLAVGPNVAELLTQDTRFLEINMGSEYAA